MLASLAVLGSSSTCFFKTTNLSASAFFHPPCFTSPASSPAISLVFIFDGIFSGFFAAVSPTSISAAAALLLDAAGFGAGVLDLNRCGAPLDAGGSSTERPGGPAKGIIGGGLMLPLRSTAVPVPRLRPLVGLGATMTSMGGVIGFDFDLSLFVGLVSAGGTVVVSAAALDELDAAPGVREALLLLALAFAVGGCAEGSRLAARGFAAALASAAAAATSRFGTEAALGTEAARGGATLSGIAAGSSFGAEFSFAFS